MVSFVSIGFKEDLGFFTARCGCSGTSIADLSTKSSINCIPADFSIMICVSTTSLFRWASERSNTYFVTAIGAKAVPVIPSERAAMYSTGMMVPLILSPIFFSLDLFTVPGSERMVAYSINSHMALSTRLAVSSRS